METEIARSPPRAEATAHRPLHTSSTKIEKPTSTTTRARGEQQQDAAPCIVLLTTSSTPTSITRRWYKELLVQLLACTLRKRKSRITIPGYSTLSKIMDFSSPGVPGIGAVISAGASAAGQQMGSPISSMSYHEGGTKLYAASAGDSKLQVIDCLNGKSERAPLRAEREQINIVEATHHEQSVLIGGKGTSITQPVGQRHAISYWSLHDNKIVRKFRGHSDKVSSLLLSF